MNRKERIAVQLGMPQGTANHKLRKSILFAFAKQLQLTTCFKCGTLIESVDEFSIEHKEPWEGRDPELFWDLNNIAFSHVRCNVPHNRPGTPRFRREGPEGTSWCSVCKQYKPKEDFYKDVTRWDGLRSRCKLCFKQYRQR